MKKIIIAASAVGAVTAGLILYIRNKNTTARKAGKVVDAASHAYNMMDSDVDRMQRPAPHTMG